MKNTDLPLVMLAGIERLATEGNPVPLEMRSAFERQTGRKLPIPQALPASAVEVETLSPGLSKVTTLATATIAPAASEAPVGKAKSKLAGGQFTGIPDAELDAFAAATDGMEAASGVAVIMGLRRALRAAFKRGASAAPYGPAVVTQGEIANLSFCSLATLKRWLPVLERAGIVRVERSRKSSMESNPSTYTMLFRVGQLDEKKRLGAVVHNEPTGGLTMSGGVSSRPQNGPCATSEEMYETRETVETHAQSARDDRSVSFSLSDAKAMADADTPEKSKAWCHWVDYLVERSMFGRATVEAQREAFVQLGDAAPAAVANTIAARLRRLCLPKTAQRSTATPSEMPDDLKIF
jgi:hypothetical protein